MALVGSFDLFAPLARGAGEPTSRQMIEVGRHWLREEGWRTEDPHVAIQIASVIHNGGKRADVLAAAHNLLGDPPKPDPLPRAKPVSDKDGTQPRRKRLTEWVSFRTTPEVRDELDRLADVKGIDRSELVRAQVDSGLEYQRALGSHSQALLNERLNRRDR